MKLIISVLIFIITGWSCSNSSVRNADDHTAIKNPDSSIAHDYAADTGANRELGNIYNEYIKRYKTPCMVDSVFAFGVDTFKIQLKHYCLMDSAIIVPKQYVKIYNLDSFVTHNFATDIKLERNNKTIFQGTVYKKDFRKFLYPQLKEYGALFCPEMNLSKDTIELDYSISIPLTDVGVGVAMIINQNGSVVYKGL